MNDYILYDKDTGEIKNLYTGTEVDFGDYAFVLGYADIELSYINVVTQDITQKAAPVININKTTCMANSVDSVVLTNIPVGSTVSVFNSKELVNDGELQLTFNFPSDFVVRVTHPHYMKYEVVIHAT